MIRLDEPWQAGKRLSEPHANAQEQAPRRPSNAAPAAELPATNTATNPATDAATSPGIAKEAPDTPSQLLAEHLRRPRQTGEAVPRPRLVPGVYRGSGKLKGYSTLVTAADAGIGRAVAQLFAREGADVAVVYRSLHEDAEETRRCVEGEGTRCLLLKGDVGDEAWCQRAVQRVVAAFGRIDVLVNNTAFTVHGHRPQVQDAQAVPDEQDPLTWQLPPHEALAGYFHMARAALPYLPRGGAIINTGGWAVGEAAAQGLDDAATRGAIQAFTQSLANRLQGRGIRVNAVAPGLARPDRAAPAYVFLAAPVCSGLISGLVLPIVGGADEV